MAIPTHYLSIYQKPALGDGFVQRMPVYNYRHSIAAVGGFDIASCDIAIRSRDEGQRFLDQFIGNRVAFHVDNPVAPIWEGFINRMSFNAGNVQYSASIDEMANRGTVTYTDPAASATAAQITVGTNDTDSQLLFGIKQENLDVGYMRSGTGSAALRATIVAQKAWPKTSITRGQGAGLLHIELLGFYHTLEWETFSDTSTLTVTLDAMVNRVRVAVVNGTTFFDNADTTDIQANVTTIVVESVKREAAWDVLKRVQEIGNGGAYYTVGITPTLFQTGTRRLYYKLANSAIEYTARQSDGLRIRNKFGQLIPPWTVQPDRGIRVSDMLIGWNGIGDNPAETYITIVNYDANQQSVDYIGDDDTRAEGAFQLRNYGRPIGKRFSATIRRAV